MNLAKGRSCGLTESSSKFRATNGSQHGQQEKNFAGQKLRKLPPELLAYCEDTLKVDLQRNRLRQVPEILQLCNLTDLNLSRNEFAEFPLELQKLQHLQKLYINQNNIKCIPEGVFPSLKKLQFLKLSTNRLGKLPSDMKECQNLSYLSLSNNCLEDLQPLVGLSKLKELFVERNQLAELPVLLFQNMEMTLFKASGNPLSKPPEVVCAGGLKDIRNYFAMLGDSPSNVRTIKTMFLGSSMAGKSTLCRSLKQGYPVCVDEADRTEGIDILEVDKEKVRFLFWDFAGQEEYYITHHVFITAHAFVILAIDLSSYNIDDQSQSFNKKVSFWIKNILLKVPNSVVQLVGTHTDECKDETDVSEKKRDIEKKVKEMLLRRIESLNQQKRNLQDLEDPSLFSDQMSEIDRLAGCDLKVLDLIPIDCTKAEDIDSFQAHILHEVFNPEIFPNIEMTLPKSYEIVEHAIQGLGKGQDTPNHGIMTLGELLEVLEESDHKLDCEKLTCILRYLHRIGIILWYDDIDDINHLNHLKDMVFTQPTFLISLFKTIVRHDLVKHLKEIPKSMLQEEQALHKHRDRWICDFEERATLCNAAIRILVRSELKASGFDDETLMEEVVGTKKKVGNLLRLLQHFDVCLPTKMRISLNPVAPEFSPDKKWEPSNPSVYDPDGACLFPIYLTSNDLVTKMWGENHSDDLNIHVYFLTEIPHGFFHRLTIKLCSFYSTHWVGRDQCLLVSNMKRVLLTEKNENEDQFIEIRCKDNESNDIYKVWDMIKVILIKLAELTKQWRGLCQFVHSPCRDPGCTDFFEWQDWQDWLDPTSPGPDIFCKEEKICCRNGHTRRTEQMYPTGPLVQTS